VKVPPVVCVVLCVFVPGGSHSAAKGNGNTHTRATALVPYRHVENFAAVEVVTCKGDVDWI